MTRPNIAVWLEVNTLRASVVADAIAGINEWGKHPAVTTIIVSTTPGRETLFATLLPVCQGAGLTLIPGIKTHQALPPVMVAGETRTYRQFDDIGGWAMIADSVRLAALYAESRAVVLENESAIIGYVKGHVPVDPVKLAHGLRRLPDNIRILWYPTITSGYADRQARQADVLRVLLGERLNVAFFDNSIDRPRAYEGDYAKKNRASLLHLNAAGRLYRLLYCYGPGSRFWMDEAIVPLIVGAVSPPDWAVLYPGAVRFKEAAESIGRLLDVVAFGALPEVESKTISGDSR